MRGAVESGLALAVIAWVTVAYYAGAWLRRRCAKEAPR